MNKWNERQFPALNLPITEVKVVFWAKMPWRLSAYMNFPGKKNQMVNSPISGVPADGVEWIGSGGS